MSYLLDTCVISELVKPSPNQQVIDWLENMPDEQLFLSVISFGEIRKGINKLPKSKKKNQLESWLKSLLEYYQDRILPISLEVAGNWGVMQAEADASGKSLASIDSLIAATAQTHQMHIVTRNVSDFNQASVTVINPWMQK